MRPKPLRVGVGCRLDQKLSKIKGEKNNQEGDDDQKRKPIAKLGLQDCGGDGGEHRPDLPEGRKCQSALPCVDRHVCADALLPFVCHVSWKDEQRDNFPGPKGDMTRAMLNLQTNLTHWIGYVLISLLNCEI